MNVTCPRDGCHQTFRERYGDEPISRFLLLYALPGAFRDLVCCICGASAVIR
jgi:hypothetical protein